MLKKTESVTNFHKPFPPPQTASNDSIILAARVYFCIASCVLQNKKDPEGGEDYLGKTEESTQKKDAAVDPGFVFGQNIKDRAKVSEYLWTPAKSPPQLIQYETLKCHSLCSWMRTAQPVNLKTPHRTLSLGVLITSCSTWALQGDYSLFVFMLFFSLSHSDLI